MKNRVLLRVLTWLLTLAMLCSTVPAGAATSNGWEGWSYADAWILNADGSLSYAGTDTGAAYQIIHRNPVDTNCVDVDLRIDGTANAGNGGGRTPGFAGNCMARRDCALNSEQNADENRG